LPGHADTPDVIVVGAGVIGLTSAICLAEGGRAVRIRTAAPPQETTSRAASAMWGSSFAGPAADVRRWALQSLDDLRALAGEPDTGVRVARGMLAARSTEEGPPEFLFPGVESCAATTPRASWPPSRRRAARRHARHLDYLLARFEARAGLECARCTRCPTWRARRRSSSTAAASAPGRWCPTPPCAPCAASTWSSRTPAWRSSS
jgi:glycine/D-amino acid oxidase-like deaminating enzyme